MSKVISGIYKIENKQNGKVYIGSSKNIHKRWKQHVSELRSKQHHNYNLQNAWHEYGEENFEFEIIEIVDDINQLIDREQHHIDLTKCYDYSYGYNVNPKAGKFLSIDRTKKIQGSRRAKTTKEDAITICQRIVSGESIRKISKDYTYKIVSGIKKGVTWKKISKDYIDHFFENSIKVLSKRKKENATRDIYRLYLKFIEDVAEQLVLPKSFIEAVVNECKDIKSNIEEKEIIKRKNNKPEKVKRKNKKSEKYLFSGLITCWDCSKNFRGKIQNQNTTVYICSGYHNKSSDCNRFAIHEKDILNVIKNYFIGVDKIDLDLILKIEVRSIEKEIKIYYMDENHSILQL